MTFLLIHLDYLDFICIKKTLKLERFEFR